MKSISWYLFIFILTAAIFSSCVSKHQHIHDKTPCLTNMDSLIKKLNEYPLLYTKENRQSTHQSGDIPPGKNAHIDVLAEYWLNQSPIADKRYPPKPVLSRLFEYCADKPGVLEDIIALIPEELQYDKDITGSIYAIYKNYSEYFTDDFIVDFLMLRSNYFREQLLENAYSCEFSRYLKNEHYILALITLDVPAALPVLEYYLDSEDENISGFARCELYKIYMSTNNTSQALEFRIQLQRIAGDKTQPGFVRDYAIHALMETEWEGMENWYVSLFKDKSLMELTGDLFTYYPLRTSVKTKPDYWIPVISKLVNHENKAVHHNAVIVLQQFNLEDARADTLHPLLPWLTDPDWAIEPFHPCRLQSRGLHPVQKVLLAVVLADEELIDTLFCGQYDDQTYALLISLCRVVQIELPLEECDSLLYNTTEPLLRSTIIQYLECIGNEAAISILTHHVSREYTIYGRRMDYDPGHFSFKTFDVLENILIKKFQENTSIEEIHALLSAGYWGGKGQHIILCYTDDAEYYFLQDNGRRKKCGGSLNVFDEFLQFARQENIDTLTPFYSHSYDGIQYEYIHMDKKWGKRIFMNNPGIKGESNVLVQPGRFAGPVVSSDGKWLVVSKTEKGNNWAPPNGMVVINLDTGDSKWIDLEQADNFEGICFLTLYHSFLLIRSRDQGEYDGDNTGPENPVHYLFNPYENSIREVDGDFGPLHQQTFRSLQATKNENRYWAALPDYKSGKTEFGIYDLTHFKFEKITEFKGVHFDSMDIWVDEENGQLYVVVNGDLVSVLFDQIISRSS